MFDDLVGGLLIRRYFLVHDELPLPWKSDGNTVAKEAKEGRMKLNATQLINVSSIKKASERISQYIVRTPLLRGYEIEDYFKLETPVYFKCENFQHTRSFKLRGAYNALLQQPPEVLAKGVVTRSSGNFAQAFACASQRLGIHAHVVMPTSAPIVKVNNTKRWGPEIILHGTTHVEGMQKVEELIKENDYHYVSPFDDTHIIAGQGTAALEITQELKDPIKHFYCSVGGGGLMAGCALWVKEFSRAEIVAVEPETANDFTLSFKQKSLVAIDNPKSIADGLLTPSVGTMNWPILRDCVTAAETVSESLICKSVLMLSNLQNIVVEPSGAVAFAAFMQRMQHGQRPEGPAVFLISGGNIDMSVLLGVIDTASR